MNPLSTPISNPWYFRGQPVEDPPIGSVGFCYKISYVGNSPLAEGRRYYVGYKLFLHKTSRKAPASKQVTKSGKPRKIPVKVRGTRDSKWRVYYGSCLPLNKLRETEPDYLFRREILYFGSSQKLLRYVEAKELFCQGALESPYYWNTNILGRWYISDFKNLTNP